MTRDEQIAKGRAAQQALETVPFDLAEQQIVDEWRASKSVDEREALYSELHAMRRVMGRLRAVINTGKVAANDKEQETNG